MAVTDYHFSTIIGEGKMNSYYDITNPDISFDWLHEVLHMKQGGLIDEYCLECHKIVVCHINHGLRENAILDEDFVKNFCRK